MRHLPPRLAFSHNEKHGRKKVSRLVDRLVRFIIALTGGLFVVGPMQIMSINQSQTKSLITVTSAVVIFALVVSLLVRVSNIETLVSTATYAAVLVVFVGTATGQNGDTTRGPQ
jgi:hypothetical protein